MLSEDLQNQPHTIPLQKVLEEIARSHEKEKLEGWNDTQAERALQLYGNNELQSQDETSLLEILFKQIANSITLVNTRTN